MFARNDVVMDSNVVDHCLVFKGCDNYNEVQGVSSVPDDPGSIALYVPLEVSKEEYNV